MSKTSHPFNQSKRKNNDADCIAQNHHQIRKQRVKMLKIVTK